jgi:hypothetical protein
MKERNLWSEYVLWYGLKVVTVIGAVLCLMWSFIDAIGKSYVIFVCFLLDLPMPELFIERWIKELQKKGHLKNLAFY